MPGDSGKQIREQATAPAFKGLTVHCERQTSQEMVKTLGVVTRDALEQGEGTPGLICAE